MFNLPFSIYELSLFVTLGAAAGFLGGLIGIGGGFVLVPGLYYLFSSHPETAAVAMPLTLGTTMACMVLTSASTTRAQLRRGAVDLATVKNFAPAVSIGTIAGAVLATMVQVLVIKLSFAAFCLYSAGRMLFFPKTIGRPGASMEDAKFKTIGGAFGTACGMLGVGGANLFVQYMMMRNVDARKAMATASALQVPIALAGTLAYIATGYTNPALPAGSLGYVYLPAMALLLVASMAMAPLGVRATHALPVAIVKKIFAGFTALVGLKMAGAFSLVF